MISRTELLRGRRLGDEAQRFFEVNLTGLFAKTSAGNIVIDLEAAPIHSREDVAEGVVRQAEEQVVFATHVSLQIETDVGQGLTRDGQDLRIAEVYQV